MGRIFCIMGKSGSGKDSVFKELLKDKSLNLKPYVIYTTRPKRSGEKDGVEYYFTDENGIESLRDSGRIIEIREYDTVKGKWLYCTADGGLADGDDNYVMITTLEGYNKLKDYFGTGRVVPLYLYVRDELRLQRIFNRERRQKEPDYSEMCRRYLFDDIDFSGGKIQSSGITKYYINHRFKNCIDEIKKDIRRIAGKG